MKKKFCSFVLEIELIKLKLSRLRNLWGFPLKLDEKNSYFFLQKILENKFGKTDQLFSVSIVNLDICLTLSLVPLPAVDMAWVINF